MSDEILARIAEREQRKVDRLRLETEFRKAGDQWTPRYQRAVSTARSIIATLAKFIPEAVLASAEDEIAMACFESDMVFVSVPPEHDTLVGMKLKEAMSKVAMQKFVIEVVRPTPQDTKEG